MWVVPLSGTMVTASPSRAKKPLCAATAFGTSPILRAELALKPRRSAIGCCADAGAVIAAQITASAVASAYAADCRAMFPLLVMRGLDPRIHAASTQHGLPGQARQ